MNSTRLYNVLLMLILLLVEFWLDTLTPLGVADGLPYAITTALAIYFGRRKIVWVVASVSIVLTVMGMYYSTSAVTDSWVVMANRAVAVLVIVAIAIAQIRYMVIEKALDRRIYELGQRDPLTSCYNRHEFSARLQRALQSAGAKPVSIIMLDLDYFKNINQELGYDDADNVLIEVAQRINQLAPGAPLARMGGDEFILLLHDTDHDAAMQLAERLRTMLSVNRYPSMQQDIALTASLAVNTAGGGLSPDDVLKKAERAVHKAKELGRDQVVSALSASSQ